MRSNVSNEIIDSRTTNPLKFYFINVFKYLIYLSFYPLVFFIDKIKKYKFIKLAKMNTGRIGNTLPVAEGYLVAKNFYQYEELKDCKIIFFFQLPVVNDQSTKIVRRVIPIYSSVFCTLLQKSLIFWKKNDHILSLKKFTIKKLLLTHNDVYKFYKKPYVYFTEAEKEKGSELIKQLGIQKGDKWICIHNRDSKFLKSKFPNYDWSYHDYRNFSVNSLKSAAEFFASKGYFVLRMGHLQEEKFITHNPKIIDYANSSLRNDFLDIYLLANSKCYFGSDSGPSDVSYTFMRPAYGINFTSTIIDSGRSHLPWLFIFKRIKDLHTGKLLSIREILCSEFSSADSSYTFKEYNVLPIENSSEDIKSLAIEVEKEMKGEQIENKEDIKNQREFWKIYYKYVDRKKMGTMQPKVSPSFLRQNIDLLD